MIIMKTPDEDVEEDKEQEEDIVFTDPFPHWRASKSKVELGLRFFAAGLNIPTAAGVAKCSAQAVRNLLNSERGRELLRNIRLELDEEFKSLYRASIQVLRDNLSHADPGIAQKAADTVLKYQKEMKITVEMTAEDLVKAILEGKA
jgi:hypothetical protein